MAHGSKLKNFRFFTNKLMNSTRCSRMQICALLLLFMLLTSCNGYDKPKVPANEPETMPAALPKINPPGEDPNFIATQDTTSIYGPHSITRNMLQDKNGNLWFASWEGIVRYDGKLFTNVTLKEGLRHFHVFAVLEDKAGNIWFGTIGGGVYRYDGQAFTLFTKTDGLAGNVVFCMMEDMFGNIWFGTGDGASRYDGTTFTTFTAQDGLSSNTVNSMVQDKTGNIWMGTQHGLCRYDGTSFTNFTKEKGLPFYNVRSIIIDKIGNIWIGSDDGLCHYDGESLTNLTTNFTGHIFEDKKGILWLSESKANNSKMTLSRYDGNTFTKIASSTQVFGIAEDRAGNIWFCTENGVRRYNGKSFTDFLKKSASQ